MKQNFTISTKLRAAMQDKHLHWDKRTSGLMTEADALNIGRGQADERNAARVQRWDKNKTFATTVAIF